VIAAFGAHWLRRRTFAQRKLPFVVLPSRNGCYPLDVNAEQVPHPESRVSLSDQLDANGVPRLRVDWRLAAQDVDSLVRTMHIVRQAFVRSGCARLEFDDASLPDAIRAATPVGGHHLGTTRMSESPRDGVVDARCAVHGMANLYVAGGAVFPTCGHANPTLTIVALAIRLADHLKAELGRAPARLAARAPELAL
jgi:choline dehydrogenase-like flavoprotein